MSIKPFHSPCVRVVVVPSSGSTLQCRCVFDHVSGSIYRRRNTIALNPRRRRNVDALAGGIGTDAVVTFRDYAQMPVLPVVRTVPAATRYSRDPEARITSQFRSHSMIQARVDAAA
jgi:hypothetical protein